MNLQLITKFSCFFAINKLCLCTKETKREKENRINIYVLRPQSKFTCVRMWRNMHFIKCFSFSSRDGNVQKGICSKLVYSAERDVWLIFAENYIFRRIFFRTKSGVRSMKDGICISCFMQQFFLNILFGTLANKYCDVSEQFYKKNYSSYELILFSYWIMFSIILA